MKRWIAALLLLPAFALLASVIASDDKQSLTAAEVINKHIAAIGGKEALAKLKTRMAVGTVKKENEPEAPIAIASEPHRLSALYRFRDYDWRFIFDGSKAETRPVLSHQMSVIAEKYREMLASGLMFNSISLHNLLTEADSGNVKFEAKGMKKLHGRPAYVVEVKRSKASPMRLYFDAEDFMWVRTDYGKVSVRKPQGPLTNDAVNRSQDDFDVDFYIETSDFRTVDGVKLPFKFEQVATYPILQQKLVGTITGVVKQYIHNLNIDPNSYK